MKFLIVGLGSIGRRHLRHLLALGEDVVLVRSGRATLPDDELDGLPVETDLETALRRHRPDGVVVATPTALHLEAALPAARAGCAILLEKPVSHTLEGLDELERAAARSGSRILVGFQFRYHPSLVKAQQLIASGALGQVLTVHAHWGEYLPQWHPWEDYRCSYAAQIGAGGVIRTLVHPLDYLRYLLGEVASLWAFAGHLSPLELDGVEDVAEIGLRFANGAIGGVHLNYVQRPPRHTLEIVGTEGTLRWEQEDGALYHLSVSQPFGAYSPEPPPVHREVYPLPEGFSRDALFRAQMTHFLAVARGQEEPRCTLEDGIRALELALTALESGQ